MSNNEKKTVDSKATLSSSNNCP